MASTAPSADLLDVFAAHLGPDEPEWEPDYNLAPTDPVRAVYERRHDDDVERVLRRFRWGLVPSSAHSVGDGPLMINARAETVASKGVFARLLPHRRCIVPADGFYEWRRTGGRKQPYFVHPPEGLFAFAALYDVWRKGERPVPSLTIITTAANAAVSRLHDRMPAILPPGAWDAWLDRDLDDIPFLLSLLVPAAEDAVRLRPVSDLVNNVRHDGPELIEPAPAEPTDADPTDAGRDSPEPPGEPRLFTPN